MSEQLFELSDERDWWLGRLLDAERAAYMLGAAEGWKAALEYVHKVRQEDFAPIARLMVAMAGSDRPGVADLELRRWGPGGREHFADPRPTDGRAAEVRRDACAEGVIPVGKVHLGGAAVHWPASHRCNDACRAIRPGWYTYREAAAIIAGLPDCAAYRETVAELRRRAHDFEAVAA